MNKLEPEFTFAGFTFPRYIPEITRRQKDGRTFRAVYYHAPKPKNAGRGQSFYLDDHGSFDRWVWCDEVDGARIDHRGWYSDEYGDSEKIRGLVVRLPHGRFLAGWSMGKGMASAVEGDVYGDITEAAYAADSIAERVAEDEREYQECEREREKREEAELERNLGGDAEETEGY
jgi:hypothetical protein